jgi:hypothetical protein
MRTAPASHTRTNTTLTAACHNCQRRILMTLLLICLRFSGPALLFCGSCDVPLLLFTWTSPLRSSPLYTAVCAPQSFAHYTQMFCKKSRKSMRQSIYEISKSSILHHYHDQYHGTVVKSFRRRKFWRTGPIPVTEGLVFES